LIKDRALSKAQRIPKLWELLATSLLRGGESEERRLTPSIVRTTGIFYTVGGIQIPAESIVSAAPILGLKTSTHVSFPACASCMSLSLALAISCPSCESGDIRRIEVMVHYECGYIGPVEEFRISVGKSEYSCPRCARELKRVGIDYGRPGAGYRCEKCGSIFQFPVLSFVCDKGHKTSLDRIEIVRFPVFEATETTLVNMSVVNKVLHTAKVLSEVYGLVVETFVPLRGESNALQVVHLLIHVGDTRYAVEIIDEAVDNVELMSSISKAIDLGIKFIVAIDEGRAEKLAQLLNTSMFIIVPYRSGDELADLIMRRLEILARDASIG